MVPRIRVKLFIVLALFFRGPLIPGQEVQPVFAPLVSMLEAVIKNNLIRLSWKDAEDIRGPVYVYRSETPFSGRPSVSLPIPVEVPYGTGSYLDEADKPGVLYYFVVASDEWGRKYTLSIPYTNMINVTIAPENVPGYYYQPGPRPEGSVPSGANPAAAGGASGPAGIGTVTVSVEEDRVIINFSGPDRSKNLLLYRSISPIRRPEDLLSALIIQQKRGAPFIDYPVPGIPYYYAVIYEEDLGSPLLVIRPGHNATAEAAVIPSTAGPPDSRDIPLPRVNLSGGIPDTPGPAPAASPGRRAAERGKMEPAVFPEDLSGTPLEGEEYQLHTIVRGYFSIRDWDKSEEELRRFLALPRKIPLKARAHFYLGQACYFQGKSREALFAFLNAQENYPSETAPWIRAVLSGFAE
ncbi:MAG: hypothetical protein LBC31_01220 [Treponema sp.]|jgi:hypothetical protein|nr:hypothetical protein [Treponema sp.]